MCCKGACGFTRKAWFSEIWTPIEEYTTKRVKDKADGISETQLDTNVESTIINSKYDGGDIIIHNKSETQSDRNEKLVESATINNEDDDTNVEPQMELQNLVPMWNLLRLIQQLNSI